MDYNKITCESEGRQTEKGTRMQAAKNPNKASGAATARWVYGWGPETPPPGLYCKKSTSKPWYVGVGSIDSKRK